MEWEVFLHWVITCFRSDFGQNIAKLSGKLESCSQNMMKILSETILRRLTIKLQSLDSFKIEIIGLTTSAASFLENPFLKSSSFEFTNQNIIYWKQSMRLHVHSCPVLAHHAPAELIQ